MQGMQQGGLVACGCQALLPGLLVSLWHCFDCLFASPKFKVLTPCFQCLHFASFCEAVCWGIDHGHGLVRPSGGSRFLHGKISQRHHAPDRPMRHSAWGTHLIVLVVHGDRRFLFSVVTWLLQWSNDAPAIDCLYISTFFSLRFLFRGTVIRTVT